MGLFAGKVEKVEEKKLSRDPEIREKIFTETGTELGKLVDVLNSVSRIKPKSSDSLFATDAGDKEKGLKISVSVAVLSSLIDLIGAHVHIRELGKQNKNKL